MIIPYVGYVHCEDIPLPLTRWTTLSRCPSAAITIEVTYNPYVVPVMKRKRVKKTHSNYKLVRTDSPHPPRTTASKSSSDETNSSTQTAAAGKGLDGKNDKDNPTPQFLTGGIFNTHTTHRNKQRYQPSLRGPFHIPHHSPRSG